MILAKTREKCLGPEILVSVIVVLPRLSKVRFFKRHEPELPDETLVDEGTGVEEGLLDVGVLLEGGTTLEELEPDPEPDPESGVPPAEVISSPVESEAKSDVAIEATDGPGKV